MTPTSFLMSESETIWQAVLGVIRSSWLQSRGYCKVASLFLRRILHVYKTEILDRDGSKKLHPLPQARNNGYENKIYNSRIPLHRP